MRSFFSAAVLAATLAGNVYGHPLANDNTPVRRRKSLGFGPIHPHAVFRSSPYQIPTNAFLSMSADADPFEVAKLFIDDILKDQLSDASSYRIREDSYTDSNTGVTHVYVRQVVNGLEVADGDMNLNIKDGMVLSYGNSFYNGPPPPLIMSPNLDTGHPLCEGLETLLRLHEMPQEGDQVIMGTFRDATLNAFREVCALQSWPTDSGSSQDIFEDIFDLKPALLKFMVVATPKSHVAQDIISNYDSYFDNLSVSTTNHFVPTDGPPEFHVDNVPDAISPVKAKMAYTQVPNQSGDSTVLNLVWKFEVQMQDNWYETAVSATAPHYIISVVDWASDAPVPPPPSSNEPATYTVFAWGTNDPSEGNRSILKENFDVLASPIGWHSLPFANDPSFHGVRLSTSEFYRNTTTTWGNNVFAQENWDSRSMYIDNYRPDGGVHNTYNFTYNPQVTNQTDALDEAKKYINTTVAQLFYTSNLVHDLYYRYGFDEVAGNFQQYNFGRGGTENDAVIANAQDGSGYNNANFMTPPDGQNGLMRMYLWNTAIPYRDGDLEAGIVIHELSHGLSTRLTGGPLNSGCLGWGESGGMGEGWGDFLATTIRSTRNYSDYAMGAWAANRVNGIRNFVYSLNETVNPSTYETLNKPGYWGVHAIGEVWAEMLWIVSQRLIAEHGFTDNLFPPAPLENGTVPEGDFYRPASGKKPLIPKHGNSLMVQLVLNGMKLQQCRPSFFKARDAIIQADQVLTGGENFCTLWKGFAERGLGPNARLDAETPWGGIRTNGHEVPLACSDT